ncbi:MAG: DNA polymerase III subunit delta [Lachnospiraceae bacterium]|nr:DNA polymerase III subunit delta [Lachnospiraceae bacterium]
MSFKDIIGQEQIVGHMKSAIRDGKVSHAYIIAGEKGSGKKLLANTFAMAIQCEEGGTEPCGMCRSCKQAMSGNNPDIKYITHEKPNVISVDEIRVQLNSDIVIKPYAREKKIYIIDEAEKMNVQAQNAMLKTIEEPPEYAVIMLLVTNPGLLLQTILSRCISLNIRAVDRSKISKLLMEKHGASEYMADLAAGFSDGVVGKAIEFASSDEFSGIKGEVLKVLKKLDSADAGELYATAKDWAEDKANLAERLSLTEMWYRDLLVVKSTDRTDGAYFKEEQRELYRQAALFTFEGITKKVDAIALFRDRMKANVNVESALLVMLLAFRDN